MPWHAECESEWPMATILVVEDDPSHLHIFQLILEQAGHRVVPAWGPQDAKRKLEKYSVRLDPYGSGYAGNLRQRADRLTFGGKSATGTFADLPVAP
ncbi:MAG: hypothetical protein KatS3mg076_2490 [Candidatus Binatia bacterium]|nr:MAG: hypothetical protein KatS3mg076_2490 [Candidatus Binatia bacterium]